MPNSTQPSFNYLPSSDSGGSSPPSHIADRVGFDHGPSSTGGYHHPGRHMPRSIDLQVARMALRMRPAAMSGWAMNAACDPPLAVSTTALARSAMKRSQSGGMALSCSETMYHDGRFFQPTTGGVSGRGAG